MMTRKLLVVLPVLAVILGCSPFKLETFVDDTKEAKATHFIQKIIDGKFEEIEDALEPSLKTKITSGVLQQMRNTLGTTQPKETNLIGFNTHTHNREPTRYNFYYQYGYGNRWNIVNIAFRTLPGGRDEIIALYVNSPTNRSLQEINRFTLKGKGAVHYVFLAGCVLTPLFVLFTLVASARTRFKGRKWPWIVFILFGIFQFTLNWTTGEVGYRLLNIQLFGSGMFTAGIYAPWFLSLSLPIGALLFWIKRSDLKYIELQPEASDNADKKQV
ncbi:MAG: hypothetical protein JNN01_17085 [Opitutaceae bacterium]|nr:hypothetical protein [Opitutaceae bacterium]